MHIFVLIKEFLFLGNNCLNTSLVLCTIRNSNWDQSPHCALNFNEIITKWHVVKMLQGIIFMWSWNKLVLFNINCSLWVFSHCRERSEISRTTMIFRLPRKVVTHSEKCTRSREQYTVTKQQIRDLKGFLGGFQMIKVKWQIITVDSWLVSVKHRNNAALFCTAGSQAEKKRLNEFLVHFAII